MQNLQNNRPNQPPSSSSGLRGPVPRFGQQTLPSSGPFWSLFTGPSRPGPLPPGAIPRGAVPPPQFPYVGVRQRPSARPRPSPPTTSSPVSPFSGQTTPFSGSLPDHPPRGSSTPICSTSERTPNRSGYMSPEYAMHGHFSVKSDVFSLGVLVLEILSGKKNTRFIQPGYTDLLCYAWSKWENGDAVEILDSNMVDSSSENEAVRCINIALLCVQEEDELRPSMSPVVLMLNSNSFALPAPQKPPFVSRKRVRYMTSVLMKSDNSLSTVVADASLITEVHPR
ncbi:hypothetical protein L1987_03477 [Smallanthus sonchifolius]|uniref:Uncharacterized protein n=1 Tax=Smallanthus sonchifolius TaxID=185202 RepID=A0ACB9KAR7_9ASTR|nr:hypothetical protein L1987_03477 [Smallanthus sonchifolius]